MEKLADLIMKYIEVKAELIKLQIKEHIILVISALILAFTLLIFAFLILILFSTALSIFLNELIGSQFVGYLIVSGCYVIIFTLLFIYRKKIIQYKMMHILIDDYFEQENSPGENDQKK